MIQRIPNFKFGPFRKATVYGTNGAYPTPFMTRVSIGRLALHVFHRGDADPDPHDHEEDFWTFPLIAYVEEVMNRNHRLIPNVVRSWRVHHRKAEYAHRVVGPWDGAQVFHDPLRFDPLGWRDHPSTREGVVVTIVWRGEKRRGWGFGVEDPADPNGRRLSIPWRDYIFGDWRGALAKRQKRRATGAS
ncbi:MAG: hypothetical protein ACREH4_08190 [Vitreimonas sp.]